MPTRTSLATIGSILVLSASWGLAGEGPASATGAGGAVVLDSAGTWRMFHVLKSPVARIDGNLVLIPNYEGQKLDWTQGHRKTYRDILAPQTTLPPANWRDADFDDSGWARGTTARAIRSPYLERLCLRGKFEVTDPAKVKGLTLSAGFHGGAVVHVNGRELAREAWAPGEGLAKEYPLDAYVGPDGKLIGVRGDEALQRTKTPADVRQRIDGRERTLSVAIPSSALRKGVNVLAVELLRAPYHKVVTEQLVTLDNHGKSQVNDLSWNTCEIRRLRLQAAAKDGLVPAAQRSAGFELWNSDALAIDCDLDQGEAGPPAPIRLLGARGGAYSGKVVLGSDKPIRGLAVASGDLRGEGGRGAIPADKVQVRYAMPWGNVILTNPANNEQTPYPANPTPLASLREMAPAEVPVYRKDTSDRCLHLPGQPETVFGAVVPIWVTVHVPKDAAPGAYAGRITISAEGLQPTPVAVRVQVLDWTIPDPAQRRTWVELIQSPDTLALEYGVPLWSDKHWELIDRSMAYLGAVGSRVLFTPLIAQSNAGNDESMVRWIVKPDSPDKPGAGGAYEYDFSILDKYLDLAEKHIGKPQVLVCNAWEWYMGGAGTRLYMYRDRKEGDNAKKTRGPLVTVLDRATGKTQNVALADYLDPNARAQWKPLYDQLRARMAKRGLEQALMLGMATDNWAYREQVEFLKDVSGNLPWVNAGHYTRPSLYDGLATFGYQSSFFGYKFDYLKSLQGWKLPELVALFERVPLDNYPTTRWRLIAEQAIFGNMRGVGRLGADTWPVAKDKTGKRVARAWERFPLANWGYLNCDSSTLAPGPQGAEATFRYEALREGLQECEARVYIEAALADPASRARLGDDLAKKYQDVMVERQRAFWRSLAAMQSGPSPSHDDGHGWRGPVITGHLWFVGSDWQGRSEKLYSLAGEVAKKLAK